MIFFFLIEVSFYMKLNLMNREFFTSKILKGQFKFKLAWALKKFFVKSKNCHKRNFSKFGSRDSQNSRAFGVSRLGVHVQRARPA